MVNNYNKGELSFTQHFTDCVKEYYRTECMGKLLEVTITASNKTTERILSYKDVDDNVFCGIFRNVNY